MAKTITVTSRAATGVETFCRYAAASPAIEAVPMTSVSVISIGENVPGKTRAMPRRNNQIPLMINGQKAKSGTAATTPQTDRRYEKTRARTNGAICTR